jgi:peptide/nickel transport system substrate-binding protein
MAIATGRGDDTTTEEGIMQQWRYRKLIWGALVTLAVLIALTGANAGTTSPASPASAAAKLQRLRIAIAPLGWDTNYTWLQSRSGQLDKRPALEYLVGIDRETGAYIPELAEKWEMSADGKHWTLTLRQGMTFHGNGGEFSAKDVRHSIFLISQPESVQTDAGLWRSMMGIDKDDSIEAGAKKVEQNVEIVDDHQVIIHTKFATPELVDTISANADLGMESKARWDTGGKELYGKKVVGTGPFEFVERKVGSHVFYKRVENHWRQTPAFKELEFRWVPEDVTRLATLLNEEVHISDVPRALHGDATGKGMKIITSRLPAIMHGWSFGGLYFASPEKLKADVPWTKKEVRQAMNMAINRQEIINKLLGGKGDLLKVFGFEQRVEPKSWNPEWDQQFDNLYGYNPTKAKELLAKAGYGAGFEFTIYLYTLPGLPEIIEIGQALALDFEAVGLRPKLVEVDFPRVREQYRTKQIHGALWGLRRSPNALDTVRIFNVSKNSVVYSYEHPFIDQVMDELGRVVNPEERSRLLRSIGDHKFHEFAEMPLAALFADAAINPKFIAEYTFPGIITGFYTHLEYIKLAP